MLLAAYIAGVLFGLIFTDDRPLVRVGLSLLWPLAFAAFAITVIVLIVVAIAALPFQRRRSRVSPGD